MDTQPEIPTQPQPETQPQREVFYVSFCAEINPNTAEEFLKVCCGLVNDKYKTLYILFSTQGGQILQGIHIYNVLRALPSKIVMHNVGAVSSVGNVIFLAGEERYANPGTTFMFHGVTVPVQTGNFDERLASALSDEIASSHEKMAHIIKDRACFDSEETIMDLFRKAETHGTDFAIEHKIIHEVRAASIPSGIPVGQVVFVR